MNVIYLGHSGFLVETGSSYYLFDHIRGDLPDLSEKKKLFVFVSHAHRDHWDPGIFTDRRLRNADSFILGFDIRDPYEELVRQGRIPSGIPVIWASPQETIRIREFTCEPLLSTDEGVAFPVRTEEGVIYHAGDLNWWHWNGDPEERNLERARNFKREIDRLKGIHIDAAFVPLDPRLEDAYCLCMDYCMETLDAERVFPMHFWKDYGLCRRYQEYLKERYPDWYERFRPVRFEGECWPL